MNTLKKCLVPLLLASAIASTPLAAQNYKPVDIKPIDPSYFTPKRHEARTYLITGGARGIGAASAIRLAREGANVVIVDVLAKEGAETVAQIRKEGGKAEFVRGDVRSNADLQKGVDVALATFGELNGALNAAGVMAAMAPDTPFDYQR